MMLLCWLVLLPAALSPVPARADGTLARVRTAGVLPCAGTLAPGLDFPDITEHRLYGLEVEVCRAIAAAVIGPAAPIHFRSLREGTQGPVVRRGLDAVFFLTMEDVIANHLQNLLLQGAPVFLRAQRVAVRADSPIQHVEELRGHHICAEPGTGSERALHAWFAERHLSFTFFPFEEQEEMIDAFTAGRCDAMADDVLRLAGMRVDARRMGTALRILPESLSLVPVYVFTRTDDGAWAAGVAWVVDTLLRAGHRGGDLRDGRLDQLDLVARELGLDAGWQARVLATVGSYDAILRRTVGADSPLDLPPGPNRVQDEGGLLVAPYAE
ncbi:ABC amino acid permease/signal transduction systems [Acidisphaera rubrifaciens HS-AP3]|uniref:ABC amino acid permease/signal transduction systems n=2 Tax=Acidisphaera TaxID=50714 RepID=A0A0D6P5K9_9PROT|nr:transporter substrate-binding domain-containing protein [Acidisphaera rubrifaciens]GAN76606.1 ABC amino acid permease/signal transduction systems [Acidisphaera rubrifaciens HS-AP3]